MLAALRQRRFVVANPRDSWCVRAPSPSGAPVDTCEPRSSRTRRGQEAEARSESAVRPMTDSRGTYGVSARGFQPRPSAALISLATSIANTSGSLGDAIGLRYRAGRSPAGSASQSRAETAIPRRCGRASSTLAVSSVRSGPPAVVAERDSRRPARLGYETASGEKRRSSASSAFSTPKPFTLICT